MNLWTKIFGRQKVDLKKNCEDRDARKATADAAHAHRDAVSQADEIKEMSNRLRALRETNHFAEMIRAAVIKDNGAK